MKIFIIGMHRSGTSMITGILHKCGLELGTNLLMGARDNPKGHFESRRFIRINQEILIANGGRWFDPPTAPIRFYPGIKKKMRQFVNEFDPQKISGFKDPRICFTFPLWREVIHPEPIKAIMVVRPFIAIAKSLKRRNDFKIAKGERLANQYVRSAFAAVNRFDVPYITAVYHRFFKDWRREVEPMLEFTGLKMPADTSGIEKFIDERLWHHRK